MRAVVTLLFLCLTTFCSSQSNIEFIGARDEPIFKSKDDSARYAILQNELSKSFAHTTDQKKLDSLFRLTSQLMKVGIIGFRKVYRPDPNFIPFENLNEHSDFDQVKELCISKGKFKRLPPNVFLCKNLEVLQLVNTSLSRLQKKANRLPNLKTIIILNNKPGKPLKLRRNNQVETLVIRGEQPTYLPTSYKNFKSLVKLDLSNNALTKFPNGAANNKKLKELLLINNAITLKDDEIKLNPYVEKLDLLKNKISKVPPSIRNLPNLKTLKFNYNTINEVAPEISQLERLESLSLYNNQLASIPWGVYQLRSLKEIDLYYNDVERLDEAAANWQNLEILYLAYNKIFSLPDNLGDLKNLRELYLHENRLSSLPENLSQLRNLKVLRINNNRLPQLPSSLSKLANLENLDISRNDIQFLPDDFFNFQHLKMLVLVANPWNQETKELLPEKAKELRAKDVVVHLNSFDETIDN